MKLTRILLPAALVAVLAALPGCKKESTETKYLDGSISIVLPHYMAAGESKTFQVDTMMTLVCPDGDQIGYYFYDATRKTSDTLVTADGVIRKHYYTYTAPDTTATLSLTFGCYLPADSKYSKATATANFVVVIPGLNGDSSITHFDKATSPTFKDGRDGREYYYTRIEDRDWMRQNLAWEGTGRSLDACAVMTEVFGRYYTWEEAQTACPAGWRLPTDAEWTALQTDAEPGKDITGLAGKMMGDIYFNGTKMWEYWREVKISDELLFSAMPVGYCAGNIFDGLNTYATFWTSDEAGDLGVCRYIYQDKDIVFRGEMSKTDFAASVRCVRE